MGTFRAVAALLLAGATTFVATPAAGLDPVLPGAGSTGAQTTGQSSVEVPDFATTAWVLADLDSGLILAQRNPHQQLRPASTLKMLTALTVLQRLPLDQLYRADQADETAEGNRVVLYNGLTYRISDLLHAALLPSANDAAMALAKANGGAEVTVAQMNQEAARLGLTDTHVVNPSGLDADGQFTSAIDLAAIGRAGLNHPEILAALQLRLANFPGKATGVVGPDDPIDAAHRVIYPIYNHNRLVIDRFPGVLGGKSGYTTLAHNTYVGGAQRDGHRLVVSLLNIGSNTYRTAGQILNWGFAHYEQLTGVGHLPTETAPAPTYERKVVPLAQVPGEGPVPAVPPAATPTSDVSAEAAAPASQQRGPSRLLTVLTVLTGLLAVVRTRVFWRLQRRVGQTPANRPRVGSAAPAARRARPAHADLTTPSRDREYRELVRR